MPAAEITQWYDVLSSCSQDIWTHYAIDVTDIVTAETAQLKLVQTLTKTFAEMPVGLAIFDQQRRLVLFNPALTDLTSLAFEFLSERPSLFEFFNRLRENQVVPEPKNSAAWRAQLAELVVSSNDGAYCATWSLANSLTYQVRGRPHPDGALAFLFEDISAEISVTQKFQSKLDRFEAIIHNLDQALAIFDATGRITLSNSAYYALWSNGHDPHHAGSIIEASRHWQSSCQPTPV